MSHDDHFKKKFFLETLRLLNDSNDAEMTQLSGSLRSVNRIFTNIWSRTHHSKISLMRFFQSIELKQNDISNLKQVHNAIPRINRIIADVGKMAEQRDMERLSMAMDKGYFTFNTQKEIKKYIDKSNQIEIEEIGKNCMFLDEYNVCYIKLICCSE